MKSGESIDQAAGSLDGPGSAQLPGQQTLAHLPDALILDTLLRGAKDTIYFKDTESRFILNSRTHLEQFGLSHQSELTGRSDMDFYPKEFAEKCRQDEVQVMQTGIPIIDRVEQAVNAKGEVITYSTCKYPLRDLCGNVIGTWGISHDITELVKAEEEIAQVNAKLTALSLIDDLSGLYNRRHFDHMLQVTMDLFTRKRIGGLKADFCLIIMDVDNLKEINDTYGHVMGDSVIRYIAGQLTANTRSSDYAFRYGGDEYALILQETDLSVGRMLGERLRSIIEKSVPVIDGVEIPLTVSLGIADYRDEKTICDLVRKADRLLYQAKSEGRNRVCG